MIARYASGIRCIAIFRAEWKFRLSDPHQAQIAKMTAPKMALYSILSLLAYRSPRWRSYKVQLGIARESGSLNLQVSLNRTLKLRLLD